VLGELQPFSSKDRRLLIVTGGEDSCGGDLAEVVRAARKTDIEVSWDIIGLGLTQALPVQPSGSVHLHYANSQAELQTIVTQLLVNDPATREFNQLAEFLHKRVEPELNGASAALVLLLEGSWVNVMRLRPAAVSRRVAPAGRPGRLW
jgi:hypothetical protein